MDDKIRQLQAWVDESQRIVFFGGAGVSTESGIPDFRSVDGLYNQQYAYPPETILSRTFFDQNPEEFYRFYRNKMLFPDAQPNAAHLKLAELERAGLIYRMVPKRGEASQIFLSLPEDAFCTWRRGQKAPGPGAKRPLDQVQKSPSNNLREPQKENNHSYQYEEEESL